MSSYQGQTDKLLRIILPSSILEARWGIPVLASNGTGSLDVSTQWVADGSEIQITLKDMEGTVVQTLKGKVYSNLFRARFKLEKLNQTGGLTFEAALPAHHIKASSSPLRLFPPIQFKDLKWKDDESGQEIQVADDDQRIACEALVVGAQNGAEVRMEVILQERISHETTILSLQTKVKDGKVRILCKPKVPVDIHDHLTQNESANREDYFHPVYFFTLECHGVSVRSSSVRKLEKLLLQFESEPGSAEGIAGKKITVIKPDGSRESLTVPDSGRLEIPKTLPGKYAIEHTVLDNPEHGRNNQ